MHKKYVLIVAYTWLCLFVTFSLAIPINSSHLKARTTDTITTPYITATVVKVTDGDTISINVGLAIPDALGKLSVRLLGIDTPELGARAKCLKESQLAIQAKKLVETHIKPNDEIILLNPKWDKYGGRIIADVLFATDQDAKQWQQLGPKLIWHKLAVPYSGHGERYNWCK
jgi:endonuclease YncB( thermonuclease family)